MILTWQEILLKNPSWAWLSPCPRMPLMTKPGFLSQSEGSHFSDVLLKAGKWNWLNMSDSLWPHGLYPTRLLRPWNSPGQNTGAGCHFLLQGIFLNQGLNPALPHWRQILYHLSHEGSPLKAGVGSKQRQGLVRDSEVTSNHSSGNSGRNSDEHFPPGFSKTSISYGSKH